MRVHRPLFYLLAAPALLMASPARQAPHAPWRTIRTPHYCIHYPPVLADWAQDVASRVEGIHAAVVKEVGYESPRAVQVILADPMEESNGSALPLLPQPQVVLWRPSPQSDGFMDAMSDWTEVLVTHEFTHIQHLTRPQNHPHLLNKLFALPLSPLSLKSPRWLAEGYATLVEGRLTGSGRPHSVSRSALLRRWSLQGKLPEDGALDATEGYRAGNMAYLVGSAYLEWLERQRSQTPDILQRLWKQMTSRKRRNFDESFTATFGFSAQDGYERFRAELAHDALEWELRVKAEGLREGELWMRTDGAVSDLALSPDGMRILAQVVNAKAPGLRVWELKAEEKKDPKAEARKARDAKDPSEVEDVAPEVPGRKLAKSLPLLNFRLPDRAEWIDDRTVKFMLKRADEEGVLKRRPALWHLDGGVDFQPASLPGGRWTFIQPIHRMGRWVLECKGREVSLPGQAAGRAVLDEVRGMLYAACEWGGTWNLVRVPVTKDGFGEVQRLTRTLSAAWNPAPSPDGKVLYFTALDARGVEIRRLDLELDPLTETVQKAPDARILNPATVLPSAIEAGTLAAPGPVPASEPYRALSHLWNAPTAAWTSGPAGDSEAIGLGGQDPLDRFKWQALVAAGTDGGPSGAVASFASTAWRWNPSATVFLAREKPSHQRLHQVQGMDRERSGAEFAWTYDHRGESPFWLSPVLAFERDEALNEANEPGEVRNHGLLGLRVGASTRWGRGAYGLEVRTQAQAYEGRTQAFWSSTRAQVALRFINPGMAITVKGEGGRMSSQSGQSFHLGGTTSALVPMSLDMDRVEQPALPAYQAVGDRFLRWRAEAGTTLRIYVEGTALWSDQLSRGPFQRVAGLELSLGELLGRGSDHFLGKADLRLGAHQILDGPLKKHQVVTLNFAIRP